MWRALPCPAPRRSSLPAAPRRVSLFEACLKPLPLPQPPSLPPSLSPLLLQVGERESEPVWDPAAAAAAAAAGLGERQQRRWQERQASVKAGVDWVWGSLPCPAAACLPALKPLRGRAGAFPYAPQPGRFYRFLLVFLSATSCHAVTHALPCPAPPWSALPRTGCLQEEYVVTPMRLVMSTPTPEVKDGYRYSYVLPARLQAGNKTVLGECTLHACIMHS